MALKETKSTTVDESPLTPSVNLMKTLNEIESSIVVTESPASFKKAFVIKSSIVTESICDLFIALKETKSVTVVDSPVMPSPKNLLYIIPADAEPITKIEAVVF